ncbi:FtsB family cell division protein [Salipaludibacillus aurantiacus]|uniref:Cell division protein DivIC n=1 Tax=Salipaludibacillus aurantiacus TaxID=1601833 RepID=A0A1H9X4Q1_9BACI|nr:septum formation initiator family protein [Salipaludibacillus aurantiacus]SES40847.1 cell division protein DivIC [Salipaludibacillus aurantiacus]
MQQDNRRKVRQLSSEYMEKQTLLEEQRLRRKKGLIRRLSVFAIIFSLIMGVAGVTLYQQHTSIQAQKEENRQMEEELQLMEREEESLKQEIEWLHDPEYIAELARRDFFLTKEGETLFQLPRSSTSD